MKTILRPATDTDVRHFAAWMYDPPYDEYDIDMGDDEAIAYFLDPKVRCHALFDGNTLAGFCTFGEDARVPGGDYRDDCLDIGMGIEPSRTGLGRGHVHVSAVVAHAIRMSGDQRLRVTIATGNERALHVWKGVGFVEASRFLTPRVMMGSSEFAILRFDPAPDAHR